MHLQNNVKLGDAVMKPLAFAISQGELAEGKALYDSNASCSSLTAEQLELIGEYMMEQMHPGEGHEVMHRAMGLTEGSSEERLFHINMARNMYCGESAGMMGSGGMMGGMMGAGMMGSGGMMDGYPTVQGGLMGGWGGMMDYGGWLWGLLAVGFWLLAIINLILLAIWLYRKITEPVALREDPLAILKIRYAKGELTEKEYEEMKKEIGR